MINSCGSIVTPASAVRINTPAVVAIRRRLFDHRSRDDGSNLLHADPLGAFATRNFTVVLESLTAATVTGTTYRSTRRNIG